MSNRLLSQRTTSLSEISTAWDHLHALRKPFRSFSPVEVLLLIGLLLFSPLLEGGTTHIAVMIIRMMILVLLSLYLWKGIRAGALGYPSLKIAPAVMGYLGIAALSTVTSPYTHQSLQWLMVLISYTGLLYLIVFFIAEWDHVVKLLVVLAGMGLLEACWAFVQPGSFGVARPNATFFNPNFLAGYLAAIWAIVLGYLCYVRAPGARKLRARRSELIRFIVPAAMLGILLLAIVYSGSRGGLLALLVGTLLVITARFGRKGLVVLLLFFLTGLLIPNPLSNRIRAEHLANPVGYARWQIWQSSVREMADHPFGVGLGLYQYNYPRYAFPVEGQIARYGQVAHSAHNEYLQMGVELGVASILIFCWGIVLVTGEAVSVMRLRLKRWQRGIVVGVSAGLASMLLHAAVDSNLHEPALAIVLTLYVGILFSVRRLSVRVAEPMRTIPIHSRVIWAGLGIALIGVIAVTVLRFGVAWMFYEAGSRAHARQDFTQAIADYRHAVALDPGKALYHNSMAATHFHVFERTRLSEAAEAAVAELRLAIALNPTDGRLPSLLGHVYVSLSSSVSPLQQAREQRFSLHQSALAAYERAVELEPFSATYRLELGRLHLAVGNRERAMAIVRQAVELEPNFLPGREWLARLYLDSEQTEMATREYREIVERQQRYASWPKNALEESFLKVDATALKDELERVRSPI